jgi:hypothetical protein
MKIRRSLIIFCGIVLVLMVFLAWVTKKPERPAAPVVEQETASPRVAEQSEAKPSHHASGLAGSTNSPKSEAVSVASVPQTRPEPKSDRARQGLAALNNEDIVFFGKVRDQFDAPVAGAEVVGRIQVNDGTEVGTDEIRLITDDKGAFTISGHKGKALGVYVKKSGYVMATTNTRFVYSHLWSEAERHNPDPNNPAIVKMWKLQGAEPLTGVDQHYKFPYTEQPVNIDLLGGKIVPSGGDLKLTVHRPSGVVSERTLQDWSIEVEAMDGGLIKADEMESRVTYAAPETGYEPKDAFIMSTNAPYRWAGAVHQTYFLTSRHGQLYGKIDFGLRINQNSEDNISVELSGLANTNGSRNWEAAAPH